MFSPEACLQWEGRSSGLLGTQAVVSYHALLFLATGGAGEHFGFVAVVAGRGRGGAGDILLLVALALHLICRLVGLLVGGF